MFCSSNSDCGLASHTVTESKPRKHRGCGVVYSFVLVFSVFLFRFVSVSAFRFVGSSRSGGRFGPAFGSL